MQVSGFNSYLRALQRMARFIQADSILILGDNDRIPESFKLVKTFRHERELASVRHNSRQYDLVVVNQSILLEAKQFNIIFDLMHNQSLLVIQAPYRNLQSIGLWKLIKKSLLITVTIDFFFIGIISKRQEQVKENFNLRWF